MNSRAPLFLLVCLFASDAAAADGMLSIVDAVRAPGDSGAAFAVTVQGANGGVPVRTTGSVVGTAKAGEPKGGVLTIQGDPKGSAVPVAGKGSFKSEGIGTAGKPLGGVLTVQGDPKGTAMPVVGSGTFKSEGVGTAGTPAGGVLTVQGDPKGTAMPVVGSGTFKSEGVGTAGSPAGGVFTVQGEPGSVPIPVVGNGSFRVEGIGTAGTPAGGVLTVQGDPDGAPLRVTSSGITTIRSYSATIAEKTGRARGSTTPFNALGENRVRRFFSIKNVGAGNIKCSLGVSVTQEDYAELLPPPATSQGGAGGIFSLADWGGVVTCICDFNDCDYTVIAY